MAKAHFIRPTSPGQPAQTVRLGATADAAGNLSSLDEGKFTKLAGESRHVLAAVGDDIDGQISSVDPAPSQGWTVGGIQRYRIGECLYVTFDGLQSSPGTGVLAIGDIVVVGTPVAKGTSLAGTYPKVCKATTPANVVQKYRVVSLGTAGSGAVGTVGVIECI